MAKIDIPRGERIGRVSSERFLRPDDERYLSLSALHDAVPRRAERATARTVAMRKVPVEISTRHSKFVANRFVHEAAPALESFVASSPMAFITGIKVARERIIARADEYHTGFLRQRVLSRPETEKVTAPVFDEEGRPPASISFRGSPC